MKLFKKVLAGVAVAAALATSAQASMITVGGVTWDPDSLNDFTGTTATMNQLIDSGTGVLSGFGVITTLNGTGASTFCPSCELTFSYGGFTPAGSVVVPTATPGLAIDYSGGWIKIWVDSSKDATLAGADTNPLLLSSATTTNGSLWADLVGHEISGVSFTGSVSGTSVKPRLGGDGILDMVGGLAFGNLNTNDQQDGADLAFSTSFTTFPSSNLLYATGTGNFDGNSIPEPESLALVGLGLLGLAAARRRKAAK